MTLRAISQRPRRARARAGCGHWFTAAALLLVGCGHSPPTQFFTLMPVRADRARPALVGGPVQVRVVHIPELLDRPERVVQSSQERLDILEQQRWGAPLDGMVRRILTEDLAARLPPGMVLAPEVPAPPNARGVVVDIEEFQPEPERRVVLDVSWSVVGGQSSGQTGPAAADPREMRRFEVPSSSNADAQVAAMNRLLGQLSDAILASLEHSR